MSAVRQDAALIPLSTLQPLTYAMDLLGPSDPEANLFRGHVIGRVIPFFSIGYLLLGSDSVSKADQSGAITTESAVMY